MPKTVLAFGTFDALDEEHRLFLQEAATFGDRLVVGVARDGHVQQLKSRMPKEGEGERRKNVEAEVIVSEAILCDEQLGDYAIIQRVQPDTIVVGFDQHGLEESLRDWMDRTGHIVPLVRLPKFAPVVDKEVNVVVGIIQHNATFLLMQRKDTDPAFDQRWEFPGGKIEQGEEPERALIRELKEETNLDVEVIRFLGIRTRDISREEKIIRIRLHYFHCRAPHTDVRREQDKTYGHTWVRPHALSQYALMPGDVDAGSWLLTLSET